MAGLQAPAASDMAMNAPLAKKLVDPAEALEDPQLGDITEEAPRGKAPASASASPAPSPAKPAAAASSAAADAKGAKPADAKDAKPADAKDAADKEKEAPPAEPLRGAVIGAKGDVVMTVGQLLAALLAGGVCARRALFAVVAAAPVPAGRVGHVRAGLWRALVLPVL